MRRPRFGKLLVALAAGVSAAGLAACTSSSPSTTVTSGPAPEKATITVDALDSADAAPLWIAIKNGYFKQQGLTVTINYVADAEAAYPGQAAHTVDFAIENYPSLFGEVAKNPSSGLRIVAADETSGPNTGVIMVPKNSGIKSLAGLKGKTIGFPSPGVSGATLALNEQLNGYGITGKDYTDDPVGLTAMTRDLASGAIDAAYAVPPFITTMETSIGAHQLADLMTGPMESFPVTGWSTTSWEEQHYPKTVAAFQRGIEQGQQAIAANPALVRQLLPQYVKTITPETANVMSLQTYVTTTSETSMERVSTVMERAGVLPANFDVGALLLSAAAING